MLINIKQCFGKRKIYTGIVNELHSNKPKSYETKPIEFIYDDKSLVSQNQIDFWNWLSRYYFVPIGDVMKAAVPSTFLLESDSLIIKKEISDDMFRKMSDEECLIYDALDFQNLKLNDISEILNKKNPYPIIQKMILNGYVELNYELKEKYRPKLLNVIFLESRLIDEINIKDSLDLLKSTPKQKELLLSIISMIQSKDYLIIKDLKKTIKFSDTTLKSLEKKGFITIKKIKIDNLKKEISIENLNDKISEYKFFINFKNKILDNIDNNKISIIAEIKKASPSAGIIIENYNPVEIANIYLKNNVTCLSVLTEEDFFLGNLIHISKIKQKINLPILCKDFFVDKFQVHLSRSYGADAILIILAGVDEKTADELYEEAEKLKMSVIVEVHTVEEAKKSLKYKDALIGINNRNLKTLKTDINTTYDIHNILINHRGPIISESGIKNKEDVLKIFSETKIKTFLIGESILKNLENNNIFSVL